MRPAALGEHEPVPGVGLQAGPREQRRPPAVTGRAPDSAAAPGALPRNQVVSSSASPHDARAGERAPRPSRCRRRGGARSPSPRPSSGPARGDQLVRRAVEQVAAARDPAAVLQRGEVDGAERLDQPRVGDHLAVHPQPGHAAVGVDVSAARGVTSARRVDRRRRSRVSPSSADRGTSGVQSAAAQLVDRGVRRRARRPSTEASVG